VIGCLTIHRLVNINSGRPRTSSTAAPRKPQHHRLQSPRSESKSFFFLKRAHGIVKRAIQDAGEGGGATAPAHQALGGAAAPAPARRARGGAAAPAHQGEAAPTRGGESAPARGGESAPARGGEAASVQGGTAAHGGRACFCTKC
jgi:hypothetical protein